MPSTSSYKQGHMDRKQIAENYQSYLLAEGYKPEVTEDGNVKFKKEGGIYILIIDENPDELYLRIAFPGFWEVKNEKERLAAFEASNLAMNSTKIVKLVLVRNNLWAFAELFLPTADAFKSVFGRAIAAIQHGVTEVTRRLTEQKAVVPEEKEAVPS
jgi:hypothetical protein